MKFLIVLLLIGAVGGAAYLGTTIADDNHHQQFIDNLHEKNRCFKECIDRLGPMVPYTQCDC